MDKTYIIKKNQEIDTIIRERKSVGNKYFVIYIKKYNETRNFRFAMSIGRKYGNAVSRNLMKRRIREIIRNNKELLEKKDFVIVIKKESSQLSFQEIEANLINLLRKVYQWKKELFC